MGTRLWGRVAETLIGTEIYQPFYPRQDFILRGLRQWIVFYNNPTITGMKCSIYASDSVTGLPSTKIAESSKVWEKSEIITLANGFFEIYYDFNLIPLQADTQYHVVYHADSYTYSPTSHVSYRVAYPDPVYSEGLTIAPEKLNVFPLALYFIGGPY